MASEQAAYAVIADDLTGAGDAGVQFATAGLRTRALSDVWKAEHLRGAEVVVVETASRGLAAAQAYGRVREAATRLGQAGVQIVYKKIDSTLRGPLGAEIDAVLDACGRQLAVVCPAYPANGRTLRAGVLLVGSVPVAETAAASDPHAPVSESHVPTLLAGQTRRNVQWMARPPAGHESKRLAAELVTLGTSSGEAGGVVVCDAQTDGDLAAIVRAVQSLARPPLLVGSAGMAQPLAWLLAGQREASVLVLCGSLHPAARGQLRYLQQANNPHVSILATVDQAGTQPEQGSDLASDPAAGLAARAQVWLDAHAPSGLVVTGGDTLHALLRALGAHGVDLEQEVAPGIPVGRIAGGPWAGLRIVSKAGGFGGTSALADAVQFLERKDATYGG
jgi:uncharacterized protein YgbK (DUF1537 family)